MININEVEKYFRNNGYDDIIKESKPFCAHYTSMNVCGNEVIWLDVSDPEKVVQKRYKLKTYKVDVEIGRDENDINAIQEKIIDNLYVKNLEMFGGITDGRRLLNLTCNQLCDWQWLIGDGKIFRETHKNGEVVYVANLVKYAVVLEPNGNPIDHDIKEIK